MSLPPVLARIIQDLLKNVSGTSESDWRQLSSWQSGLLLGQLLGAIDPAQGKDLDKLHQSGRLQRIMSSCDRLGVYCPPISPDGPDLALLSILLPQMKLLHDNRKLQRAIAEQITQRESDLRSLEKRLRDSEAASKAEFKALNERLVQLASIGGARGLVTELLQLLAQAKEESARVRLAAPETELSATKKRVIELEFELYSIRNNGDIWERLQRLEERLEEQLQLERSTKEIALLKEVQEFLHPAAPDADLKMAVGNLNAQVASWQPILASAQQLQARVEELERRQPSRGERAISQGSNGTPVTQPKSDSVAIDRKKRLEEERKQAELFVKQREAQLKRETELKKQEKRAELERKRVSTEIAHLRQKSAASSPLEGALKRSSSSNTTNVASSPLLPPSESPPESARTSVELPRDDEGGRLSRNSSTRSYDSLASLEESDGDRTPQTSQPPTPRSTAPTPEPSSAPGTPASVPPNAPFPPILTSTPTPSPVKSFTSYRRSSLVASAPSSVTTSPAQAMKTVSPPPPITTSPPLKAIVMESTDVDPLSSPSPPSTPAKAPHSSSPAFVLTPTPSSPSLPLTNSGQALIRPLPLRANSESPMPTQPSPDPFSTSYSEDSFEALLARETTKTKSSPAKFQEEEDDPFTPPAHPATSASIFSAPSTVTSKPAPPQESNPLFGSEVKDGDRERARLRAEREQRAEEERRQRQEEERRLLAERQRQLRERQEEERRRVAELRAQEHRRIEDAERLASERLRNTEGIKALFHDPSPGVPKKKEEAAPAPTATLFDEEEDDGEFASFLQKMKPPSSSNGLASGSTTRPAAAPLGGKVTDPFDSLFS